MSAMSDLTIRVAEVRSIVTGKDFDTCLDELLAERPEPLSGGPHKAFMYETLYGPSTRTAICYCSRGYDHQALEATHASGTPVSVEEKTADEVQLAAADQPLREEI